MSEENPTTYWERRAAGEFEAVAAAREAEYQAWLAAHPEAATTTDTRVHVPLGGDVELDNTIDDAVAGSVPSGTLPPGGAVGTILTKSGAADYAAAWQTAHGVPAGGAAGTVLTKASATDYDAAWQASASGVFGCQITCNVQTIPNATWTQITPFNVANYDNIGGWDPTGIGPEQISVTGRAGIWGINCLGYWDIVAVGERLLIAEFNLSSAVVLHGGNLPNRGGSRQYMGGGRDVYKSTAGYWPVTLWAYQNSGGALNLSAISLAANYRGALS